ncbi:Rrf2 family transcriptional regulator [Patescibacteria group bacterium]|nr:Rrf2 family transcriptional regulator [Patescibacteria group bacterium]
MELLAKLFGSGARIKTLRLFMFNKDVALTVAEVALRTKLSKEVVRRELIELAAAGLIRKKRGQTPPRYQTNSRFEHLAELDTFIRETTSIRPKNMVDILKKAGPPRLIALSGLFTGVQQAQIDLLVVGDALDERSLANAVHSLEAELGREIRYATFATPDFRYRLGIYDRLLRDVFDYPHRLLIDKIGL